MTLNAANEKVAVPRGIGGRPHQTEPLGTILALLGGVRFEAPVYIHRGLTSYESALSSPYVYLPLDAVRQREFLRDGDIADLAAALAPAPLRFAKPVDAANRPLSEQAAAKNLAATSDTYRREDAADRLTITTDDDSPAEWLIKQLATE